MVYSVTISMVEVIGAPVHAAYPRHMATDDRAVLPIGMAVIVVVTSRVTEAIGVPVVNEERIVDMAGGLRRMRVGRLGHVVARRIMGTVRAEGNNTTRRKVCPTSQCEPDESCRRQLPIFFSYAIDTHTHSHGLYLCVVTRLCVVLSCVVCSLLFVSPNFPLTGHKNKHTHTHTNIIASSKLQSILLSVNRKQHNNHYSINKTSKR